MPTRASWLAFFLCAACAHYPALVPAPNATPAPGGGAAAAVEGVEITVDGTAWDGYPSNLSEVITPLLVRITNRSGRPLELRYQLFTLKGASGFQYAALPPFHPQAGGAYGQAVRPAAAQKVRLARPHRNFFVAPYYGPFFDTSPWPYPFYYEPGYYDRYYALWGPPLPSPDMLTAALPEGVLEQDGEVTGFLYFQRGAEEENTATFHVRLVDAKNDQPFGELEIPLIAGKT